MLIVADSPAECASISPAEKKFLESALSGQTITGVNKKVKFRLQPNGIHTCSRGPRSRRGLA